MITLIAVSKTATVEMMEKLYHKGVRHFGENRVEALLEKKQALKKLDITWHFIGKLQTKKVKKVINEIDFLHSLDSLKLALAINQYATKKINVFIQVNITKEATKSGISEEEFPAFYEAVQKLEKINVIGLMTMAKENDPFVSTTFKKLALLRKNEPLGLSMGMSNDYLEAIKEGATHLRLGRILFRSDES